MPRPRTAAQKAALKKAQAASARKRRKSPGARIDRKIKRVNGRADRRIKRKARTVRRNVATDGSGGLYVNRKGAKALTKGRRIHNRRNKKVARLTKKKAKR